MIQIKTIKMKLDSSEAFDNKVNEALKDGWILVKRDVLPPFETMNHEYYRMLYAELERRVDDGEAEPPALESEVKP